MCLRLTEQITFPAEGALGCLPLCAKPQPHVLVFGHPSGKVTHFSAQPKGATAAARAPQMEITFREFSGACAEKHSENDGDDDGASVDRSVYCCALAHPSSAASAHPGVSLWCVAGRYSSCRVVVHDFREHRRVLCKHVPPDAVKCIATSCRGMVVALRQNRNPDTRIEIWRLNAQNKIELVCPPAIVKDCGVFALRVAGDTLLCVSDEGQSVVLDLFTLALRTKIDLNMSFSADLSLDGRLALFVQRASDGSSRMRVYDARYGSVVYADWYDAFTRGTDVRLAVFASSALNILTLDEDCRLRLFTPAALASPPWRENEELGDAIQEVPPDAHLEITNDGGHALAIISRSKATVTMYAVDHFAD